jgi:hypothetical protein
MNFMSPSAWELQPRIGEPAKDGAEVEIVERDGEPCRIEAGANLPRRRPRRISQPKVSATSLSCSPSARRKLCANAGRTEAQVRREIARVRLAPVGRMMDYVHCAFGEAGSGLRLVVQYRQISANSDRIHF